MTVGGRLLFSDPGQGSDVSAFAMAVIVSKKRINQSHVNPIKSHGIERTQPAIIFFHAFHVLGK